MVFVVLSFAGAGAWSLLIGQHRTALERQTEAIAEQYAIRIEEYFASRLQMALFLRDAWTENAAMSEPAFRRFAETMHARFSAIQAVNWIDGTGVVRWVTPVHSNQAAIGLNVDRHPIAGIAFAKARETGAPAATQPVNLAQGGNGFALYLPVAERGTRGGYINVVFRIDEVFPSLWRNRKSTPFALMISDREVPIVKIGEYDREAATTAAGTALIVDRPWDVRVRFIGPAAPGFLSSVPHALPPAIAILLAALVGFLLYLHLRQVRALKDRESALTISESRLRSFLHNSPSMVVIKDLKGRYDLVNRRIEEWFGISPENAIGRSSNDFFDAETAAHLNKADELATASGKTQIYEHRKYFADGSEHILVGTKFPIRDAAGRATGTGSIVTDVTEQRQAEAQLRQIQKMEAVGNMTGGLAHDFNNLLTIILGNLQMLERRLDGDDLGMAESAIRAARRASEVTQRLLAFSRRHPLSPERVELPEFVAGLEGLLISAMGRDIKLRVKVAADLWPCHVDQGQLESALVNLAINARDAMPDGGTLTIALANARRPTTAKLLHDEPGPDLVEIAVGDTGVGMPRQVLEQAVDPFFTTKVRGQGTGLGLSMVYGFVNQSGGGMYIDSTQGKGTCVTLRLPRARDGKTPVEDAAALEAAYPVVLSS
jgi:PAS domain S-box-containing protein